MAVTQLGQPNSRKKQIFYNIKEVITMAGAKAKLGRRPQPADLTLISNPILLVENGRIHKVVTKRSFDQALAYEAWRQLPKQHWHDLEQSYVYPGFVDPHTHSIFGGNRAHELELRIQGMSYQEVTRRGGGIGSTVSATRKTANHQLATNLQQRLTQFLKQGVTTIEVKSGYGLSVTAELRLLRIIKEIKIPDIVPTYLGLHSIPKNKSADSWVKDAILGLHRVRKENLAQRIDAFLEKGFFDIIQVEKFFAAAKKLGFDITLHTDQLSHSGQVARLLKWHPQSLDHLVAIKLKDIKALGASHCVANLLPVADFYMNLPYPPARQLIAAGARVALGSDFNPGTAPSQSLSLVGILARLNMKMTLAEVWTAMTVNAGASLGRADVGHLEPGALANFFTASVPWDAWFYEVNTHPVVAVYYRGQRQPIH